LKSKIEALGVEVKLGTRVAKVCGDHRVDAVELTDGSVVDADTVVICTGVRANTDLARDAKLGFERGILVNEQMQTRDPAIYAVGDCAQFEDQIIGLVGQGYMQAEVVASAIQGQTATYTPQSPATKLKILGADVFSVGSIEQLEVMLNVKSHVWETDESYRRIFVARGKLVGVIAVGAWDQASKMQEAVQNEATVYPWMVYQFRKRGALWGDAEVDLADLPNVATICNCTGVNCGQIRSAIVKGAADQDAISAETGAGTVCGTCKPLLEEMIDAGAPPKPAAFYKPLIGISSLAIILTLIPVVFGYVPMPTSFDADSLRTWAWRDNIVKQWSGYILLGIICAAMVIGLRKRIRALDRLGGYDGWRLVHIAVGLLAISGFFVHTGFRLGENWNFLLGIAFIATLLMGAFAGFATGGDHKLRGLGVGTSRKPARRLPTAFHILAVWPLPVLILFHVLAIYAF
jgi:nitrite reductase (NADH) large subunit